MIELKKYTEKKELCKRDLHEILTLQKQIKKLADRAKSEILKKHKEESTLWKVIKSVRTKGWLKNSEKTEDLLKNKGFHESTFKGLLSPQEFKKNIPVSDHGKIESLIEYSEVESVRVQ